MLPAESRLSAGRDPTVRLATSTPMIGNTCLPPKDRSGTPDDRRAIISAATALIPFIAALAGCRFVNPSLVDGLLQAISEARGLNPT